MKKYFYLVATDQLQGIFIKILQFFLRILSWVYRLVVHCVLLAYKKGVLRSMHLGPKVISVGNITLGGVGKTPLVHLIAKHIKSSDREPVILTRGYMHNNSSNFDQGSDEAKLLKNKLNNVEILIGSNRVKNAKEYLKNKKADVFILDDGFQHWKIHRDLDIVLINVTNPWGNGFLLPRGTLREDLSALKRANLIVLTKVDLGRNRLNNIKVRLQQVCPCTPIIEAVHQAKSLVNLRNHQNVNISFIKDKAIVSFCSIGDPDSFIKTLKNLGAKIVNNISSMDHHAYNKKDIREISDYCLANKIDIIITTEKDAVKLEHLADHFDQPLYIYYLEMELSIIHKEKLFYERIRHLLQY